MCVDGCLCIMSISVCSKINVYMRIYHLFYFLYFVYVCNEESMHTNIMYKLCSEK